jgi:hypothetical protein
MKIAIVFDGPPEHFSGRFVEVENEAGESINAGTWEEMPNGWWRLWIDDSAAVAAARAEGARDCQATHTVRGLKEITRIAAKGYDEGQRDALASTCSTCKRPLELWCVACGQLTAIAAIKGDSE